MNDPRRLLEGEMLEGFVGEARVATAADTAALPAEAVLDETLAGIATKYAIFTHGPLFTYAGLDFATMDPLREFVEAQAAPCAVAIHDFAAPLFRGIARHRHQEAWDRRLCFVDLQFWPALLPWLANVAPVDRQGRRYHKAVPQVLRIVDRAAVLSGRVLTGVPTVAVTVFGVTGNVHHVRFRADTRTIDGLGEAVRMPIAPAIRREAERVLGGDRNPLRPRHPH